MNVSLLRRVDAVAGIPACFLLTIGRRAGDLWRRLRGAKRPEIRRILFVKLAEQGATVLAYPAIRTAVEMVGRENVYFLVFQENRFILDVMDVVPRENVLTLPTSGAWQFGKSLVQVLARLRRIRPDAAVDFEFFARGSAVLTYLSGAKVRVGMHGYGDAAPYRGDLMTHRVRYDPHRHTSEAFAAMTEAVGRSPDDLGDGRLTCEVRCDDFPVFEPSPAELADVDATIRREAGGESYRPLVLLNANASDILPLRRWPAERYVELAGRLLGERPDLRIAFTGSPEERAAAERLAAEVGSERCFSMAGKTTLRQLLVLYCLADVLVTNDSGPAHFAALTPLQVVALFGPETPKLFGSRSPRTRIAWKGLPCSPCVSALNNRLSTCRDARCMREISVEEVHSLVSKSLS